MRRESSIPYLLGNRFYRLGFDAWGDPQSPPVLCVHGLTRNGRDFDALARALSDRFYVICPDLPGRGRSDWLPDPMLYQPPHYVTALTHLLAYIARPTVWIGTSLGGICGMLVCAAQGAPVTRLVLNDIGPFIPAVSLARIRDYMVASGDSPLMQRMADLETVERHLRLVHAPFGPMTDAQWAEMARISSRQMPDGKFAMHYDPKIAEPMRGNDPVDVDMWPFWNLITIPRLVIRGETSDVLDTATFARMQETGAQGYQVPITGHAPPLLDDAQIGAIRDFLMK